MVAMIRLVLARHGATDWTSAGRLTGWTDVPLNADGRGQARRLGRRLAGEGLDSVWSSDLRRAADTATIAAGGARVDPRLRELDFGSLEGRIWESCPAAVRRGLMAFDGFRAPGGESVEDLRRRVLDFVAGLPEGSHLLVTHGGVIRTLLRWRGRDEVVVPGELRELTLAD
jgi:probable phosphoglycerate mutase